MSKAAQAESSVPAKADDGLILRGWKEIVAALEKEARWSPASKTLREYRDRPKRDNPFPAYDEIGDCVACLLGDLRRWIVAERARLAKERGRHA